MSAPRSVRCLRQAVRSLSTRPVAPRYLPRQAPCASHVATRSFSNASRAYKGILPDTDEPTLKDREPLHEVKDPTPIEIEEYHERADHYLEELVSRAEELAEEKEGVDVEYSAGVLNIVYPPNGTYVVNKQPPTKQIWLSSPISGPKRFDWVMLGESQQQKEGAASGDWIYLRDKTSLTTLLRKELGITVGEESTRP
ncbi:arabinogalactan endo-1,4-beta-galactosidase [Aureobasidium namibiae CBS 147.97]|uniref:ferroxidase n=1 Tax=Aureobasidium namibiae CBS 147.97 TaxID=1043004 RepID=A0A074X9A8_9PEZI